MIRRAIAAGLRLLDAIEQHRLCPFADFGISDGLDYTGITWRRGQGYAPTELTNLLTRGHALARKIIANNESLLPAPAQRRVLDLCVSVAPATILAAQFNAAGLQSVAFAAATSAQSRSDALRALARGELRCVFSVDLFDEGMDIPIADAEDDGQSYGVHAAVGARAAQGARRVRTCGSRPRRPATHGVPNASPGMRRCWATDARRWRSRSSRAIPFFPAAATCNWMRWRSIWPCEPSAKVCRAPGGQTPASCVGWQSRIRGSRFSTSWSIRS
jgi:hypothetical protein